MDCLTARKNLIAGGVATLLTTSSAIANPFSTKDLPFDQVYSITTHNAYEKINQNLRELPEQLKDGVRGFMLDLYYDSKYSGGDAIRVCHNSICYGSFANQVTNEFLPFLAQHRNEIVTLFLETYITRSQLQRFLDSYPSASQRRFQPE
jgi:hypothetical protein